MINDTFLFIEQSENINNTICVTDLTLGSIVLEFLDPVQIIKGRRINYKIDFIHSFSFQIILQQIP